ncbi:MAG: outer membrane beta-barrel protein [Fimbriimonadaceae bacterium]|nr:outer membrane beta-barrel protein [Alphaproteobacteria bacterium]
MIKKLLVGSVSALALAGAAIVTPAAVTPATGADYGTPDLAYDWSGWYWGLKGGFGSGDARQTALTSTGDYTIDGYLFGTMSSYNYQTGNLVIGLDADSGFSGIEGTTAATNASCGGCTTEINWLSTVRGRVGIAMDRVLPFVTAGVAFGEVEATRPIAGGGTDDDIYFGYVLGAGVDWAFADGWHARLDYQYVDLGTETMAFAGGPVRVGVNDLHLVRVGISTDIRKLLKSVFQGG